MTDDEFWHKDLRILQTAQKAYYRDVQYRAWWIGQYEFSGTSGAIYNGFNEKAKNKPYEYPQYEDFTNELYNKPKVTKENLETEFRQEMVKQQSWLHSILNK